MNITRSLRRSVKVFFKNNHNNIITKYTISRFQCTIPPTCSINTLTMCDDLNQRIVWVDLEMTGLDIEKDHIIEMACIITDKDLNVLAETPSLILHQPDSVLHSMGEWCQKHHGKSGLTEAVRESQLSLTAAEQEMVSFLQQHVPEHQCPLAGNSIHADKVFLEKYMPKFVQHLHYRIIDVSSIKELCRRWYLDVYKNCPRKKLTHRALDDIKESIKELQYYRTEMFQ